MTATKKASAKPSAVKAGKTKSSSVKVGKATTGEGKGRGKGKAKTGAQAATHPHVESREAVGRQARKDVPRATHADWTPAADRPDAVALLEEQNLNRLQWLVPVRRGRMMVSPFTFYRGAARIMATDLAPTPTSGLEVQACGDAHLSNFGAYASPERNLVVDANDFDETLPGPWEWDLKRLAASFMIAGQHRGLPDSDCRSLAARSVEAYRKAMIEFAGMGTLDLWYRHLAADDLRGIAGWTQDKTARKAVEQFADKARSRDNLQALRKLAVEVDGRYQIRSDPPVLIPLREVTGEGDTAVLEQIAMAAFEAYKETLHDDRRFLVERFTPIDIAVKVVGVGSVGTRCLIMLLEGRDRSDPLFLQIKEATTSVLADHLPPSRYDNAGRRVVEGQRLLQAVSDIFLGWTRGASGRDFYVRQLRDWKGSVDLETAPAERLDRYARICGWTLARGHARTGDAIAIAAYLGKSDEIDKAFAEFSAAYAAQNLRDYEQFTTAIRDGDLEAVADR